jgi:NAD(P)-dependent dehydrogenase (short-subunit alcohol dehydrogenase family)
MYMPFPPTRQVVVNYVSSEGPAAEVVNMIKAAGGEAIAVKADVSKQEEVVELFKTASTAFGDTPVSLLVNNGGITRDALAIRWAPPAARLISCSKLGRRLPTPLLPAGHTGSALPPARAFAPCVCSCACH